MSRSVSAPAGKPAPKRRTLRLLLASSFVVFALYLTLTLTQLQMEKDERQQALEDISRQVVAMERSNEDLQDKLDNKDKYLEEQARQRGMAQPGEMVFQEIPGIESPQ